MRIFFILVLIISTLTIAYGFFIAGGILRGPDINIQTPKPYEEINNAYTLRGQGKGIKFLTINDKRVFPLENGSFKTDLLLPVGYNVIEVYSYNRNKRETRILIPVTAVIKK